MANPKRETLAARDGSGRIKALHSNDSAAQREKLYERLLFAPITTIEARRDLDILMPAARIFELRERGHRIDKVWTWERTACGKMHRVALYALRKDAPLPREQETGYQYRLSA